MHCSAARSLARKLAEEKQAAAAAARLAAEHSIDEEEIEAIRASVEAASAGAAREAARADANARAAAKNKGHSPAYLADLERLRVSAAFKHGPTVTLTWQTWSLVGECCLQTLSKCEHQARGGGHPRG